MTTPDERLFRALIDNAADESLNHSDEWEQEMAKWFFYTDEYELLHRWIYDAPGDGFRERLELLWRDIEDNPERATEYRNDLRKLGVNQERNVRLHRDSGVLPDSWYEQNALKERDEKGRYK